MTLIKQKFTLEIDKKLFPYLIIFQRSRLWKYPDFVIPTAEDFGQSCCIGREKCSFMKNKFALNIFMKKKHKSDGLI